MKLIHHALTLFTICLSVEAEYQLDSELRRNFNNGSTTSFLTGYTYDNSGNRTEKVVFDGPETASIVLSTTKYAYDNATNRLIKEVLLTGNDTLSTVIRSYDKKGGLTCLAVNNSSGDENYRDSIIYNSDGKREKIIRYSKDTVLFYYALSYDSNGRKCTDTLFELSEGSFVSRQATSFVYNEDGNVLKESGYRRDNTAWYSFKTSVMVYANGCLSSVTVYDGDGIGKRMVDSTALFFDAYGNKIREQCYNDERTLTIIVDYNWSTSPVIRQPGPIRRLTDFLIKNGEIQLVGGYGNNAVAVIYTIQGKMVGLSTIRYAAPGKHICKLPPLSPGIYAAQLLPPYETGTISFVVKR